MRDDRASYPSSLTGPPGPSTDVARDLEYIRDVVDRSLQFTTVPGWGLVAMGLTAFGAAFLGAHQTTFLMWVLVWTVEAAIASGLGVVALRRKARRLGTDFADGTGRKYLLGLLPPLIAGAVLTVACIRHDAVSLLPGVWLLLYGVGVVTGGAFSIRLIPTMGACFMILGVGTFFLPEAWTQNALALGFGGFHVYFGLLITQYNEQVELDE